MSIAKSGVKLAESSDIVEKARNVLLHEADEIRQLAGRLGAEFEAAAVSYTHLTLPTSDLV